MKDCVFILLPFQYKLEVNYFIFFHFLFILSCEMTMTDRLYFFVDAYAKSRENSEHQLKKLIYVCIVLFASIVISWLFQKQI